MCLYLEIEQFNGERVYLVDTSSANNNSVEAYCSPDNGRSGPDIREYHVFVKESTFCSLIFLFE